jgi:hypothetical protein
VGVASNNDDLCDGDLTKDDLTDKNLPKDSVAEGERTSVTGRQIMAVEKLVTILAIDNYGTSSLSHSMS